MKFKQSPLMTLFIQQAFNFFCCVQKKTLFPYHINIACWVRERIFKLTATEYWEAPETFDRFICTFNAKESALFGRKVLPMSFRSIIYLHERKVESCRPHCNNHLRVSDRLFIKFSQTYTNRLHITIWFSNGITNILKSFHYNLQIQQLHPDGKDVMWCQLVSLRLPL